MAVKILVVAAVTSQTEVNMLTNFTQLRKCTLHAREFEFGLPSCKEGTQKLTQIRKYRKSRHGDTTSLGGKFFHFYCTNNISTYTVDTTVTKNSQEQEASKQQNITCVHKCGVNLTEHLVFVSYKESFN
jgi:hypothetical protein